MLQNIGYYEWKVILGNYLLTVAKFGDTLGHGFGLLRCELKTEFLEVLRDIGLAGVLTKGILTLTAKTFRYKSITVQMILTVAVSVNASHLCEDILSYNRLIRCNGYTTITGNKTGDVIKTVLMDVRLYAQLILQCHLDTGQRSITTTLAKTVYGNMQSLCTAFNGGKGVTDCHVVIIVGMEVEVLVGIAFRHLLHILKGIERVKDAQSIREKETFYVIVLQRIHHIEDVIRAILHP